MRTAFVLLGMMALSFGTISYAQKPQTLPSQVLPAVSVKPVIVTPEEQSGEQNSSTQASVMRRHEENAKRWGLKAEDWQRFEEIKKGPRGYWSPNLDPLTALGVEARSENERVRFAQIQAKMEFERVERELAYQRTYDAVFNKIYGNVLPINLPANKSEAPTPSRLALFIKLNCAECDKKAKKLQADKTPFDVYIVGTGGNDGTIRDWAKGVGISPKLVQSKTITLNHDNGTLQSLGGSADKLPAVYQLSEGSGLWVRIE
ncbi:MAG: TIGR03759 family integrating conjugative element protein [Betaproteobacteria bacterium]|nr:TIGR03759 family integrating conjugative element protein [Betaproteobacteria bacterium]